MLLRVDDRDRNLDQDQERAMRHVEEPGQNCMSPSNITGAA